ncbi:MAG: RNA polymerase sigma-70 factor (ECF subfamily) [Paracoccaceae bacterium]|jgi:RNA polymerase sigma-70 factor (ECF subfamily)
MEMPLDAADAEDDVLVARFVAGDADAARVLAARHAPRLMALARRMLRDEAEAEDVTQEAMLRLWRGGADWRSGEAKLSTWLHRVAANLCVDRLRRRGRMSPDAPPDMADEAPSALAGMVAADRSAAVRAALDDLPERQRVAVTLRHFAEMTNPDIAARMELSVEAVESLISRGRRGLARALTPLRAQLGLDGMGAQE